MPGGQSGSHKGGQHARADCPACGRPDVPGGVDRQTGHIWLRRHTTKPGSGIWCSNRERVDAGPGSPLLDFAYKLVTQSSSKEQ